MFFGTSALVWQGEKTDLLNIFSYFIDTCLCCQLVQSGICHTGFFGVAVLAASKWRSSSDVLLTTWEDHWEDHKTNTVSVCLCGCVCVSVCVCVWTSTSAWICVSRPTVGVHCMCYYCMYTMSEHTAAQQYICICFCLSQHEAQLW